MKKYGIFVGVLFVEWIVLVGNFDICFVNLMKVCYIIIYEIVNIVVGVNVENYVKYLYK